MNIRKRNGSEVKFNRNNIIEAISRANEKVRLEDRLTIQEIKDIAKDIDEKCKNSIATIQSNDIQNFVENSIMKAGKFDVAKEYITYRYQKALDNRKNTIDDRVLSLLNNDNEDIQQENANKNPTIVSTMRDYMAGEVSKDISQRYLLPADIYQAHKEGKIHFHDLDYFAMPIHNCDLWNLEDMLQNGTVINNVKIEKPHTFLTAATITSQISAIVASSQYGGQTFTLAHLAPFVEEARKYYRKKFREELTSLTPEQLEELVEKETRRNVKDGIQTLQYQLVTISTTNGQTPFVSVCMYLNEAKNEKEKEDLALIIEEVLKQRIQGLKNEAGEYVTNAFPKLLYILEEDNIHEGDKYYYLTELAASCSMKRMIPDYISEKIMKEWKKDKKGNGYCFPTMGCRSILSVWTEPKHDEVATYSEDDELEIE